MKVVIDIPEDRYADIQRIASVQLERRYPTPEQIIAKGVTINELREWIPVSERLPELDDEVLVTDDGGELRHCIFCTCGKTWCGFITYEEGMRIKAAAWMPLPEPYKGVTT